MFTVEERDRVRERLLEMAKADPFVAGAAITGSYAAGASDEWSDVDLAFALRDPIPNALGRWTRLLEDEFGAIQHRDLPFGSTVYRVFLLPNWLEVDIAFSPTAEFGPRGPNFRVTFGQAVELPTPGTPRRDDLIGLAWHHVLHARASIERGRAWQAEYWIGGVRDQVIELASLRIGSYARYAKAAHLLPPEVTEPLETALVRSLDEAELRRALAAAAVALATELERTDTRLAATLGPMLLDLTGSEAHPDV